ncbi:MAG TPA: hypothetical protein VEH30_04725 [Terriglobales bacterium]|nr:hypothetical protein [Terriglobales bacterium]
MKSLLRRATLLTLSLSVCAISTIYAQDSSAGESASAGVGQQPSAGAQSLPTSSTITIPGPLRSFLRMAGISQKVSTDEVVPLLARNVFSQGYEGSPTKGHPTEFLILLMRYVQQARELESLAGSEQVIRISGCADAKSLLRVLGYRVRQDCGKSDTSLVTSDPERAFLTIDSGFPLPELEETLQGGGKPFVYLFPSPAVPLIFTENDWMGVDDEAADSRNLLDKLLRDPLLARLYWALYRNDAETRDALRHAPGLRQLLPRAAVLDFYGSDLRVRSGRVIVPGGVSAESAWKSLVGESPESSGPFVLHLLTKDKGWLAAYFDAISRVNQTRQAYFTEPHRLHHFYEALRSQDLANDAARPVFRPAPGLLLLLTRLQWEPNGEPYLPGGLEVWKQIFHQRTDSKFLREWGRRAAHWNRPEQVAEGLFAVSRVETDAGPLQIYLLLSELDSKRSPHLSPQTVLLLASKFSHFSNQYLIFSEFPALTDASIAEFLNAAEAVNKIPNHTLRGNAMGIFQASIGLWQILARQGEISSSELNPSWQNIIKPFNSIHSEAQLYDAGRHSVRELMAASGKPEVSQDELVDLLAGPPQSTPEGGQIHEELAERIRSIMEAQRLVSLDTMLALGDGLEQMAKSNTAGEGLVPLARELSEFEMPRPIFTSSERTQWAAGIYNNRHTELQLRTDLTKVVKTPASHEQLEQARGQIAPFLRDTLVGLNYAYYEPPGAQVLHNNPLFVRSHDFSGDTVAGVEQVWQAPLLFGEGSPAGGGAHLVGSLADLPYVLAGVEQDFIGPENVQALIWRELVPGLLVSATLPRWWGVSQNELHAISLYQRAGEELLRSSANNEQLRGELTDILSDRMAPQMLEQVERDVRQSSLAKITPADTFYLAAEFRRKYAADTASWGPAGRELDELSRKYPEEVGLDRLSRDFGVPHPILAQTYCRELLNVKPFPAFEGYSSRLLAETWDSSNLYWARLADEMGYSPLMLNTLVPQLTRRMVEKIFATDFEDWQAILRAMRETGEEFRQKKNTATTLSGAVIH